MTGCPVCAHNSPFRDTRCFGTRLSRPRDTPCFGTDFGVSGHPVFWDGFRRFGTPGVSARISAFRDTSASRGHLEASWGREVFRDGSRRPGDAPECPETPFGVSGHQVSQNAFLCFATARGVPGTEFCDSRRRPAWDGRGRAGTVRSVPEHRFPLRPTRRLETPKCVLGRADVFRNAISSCTGLPGTARPPSEQTQPMLESHDVRCHAIILTARDCSSLVLPGSRISCFNFCVEAGTLDAVGDGHAAHDIGWQLIR